MSTWCLLCQFQSAGSQKVCYWLSYSGQMLLLNYSIYENIMKNPQAESVITEKRQGNNDCAYLADHFRGPVAVQKIILQKDAGQPTDFAIWRSEYHENPERPKWCAYCQTIPELGSRFPFEQESPSLLQTWPPFSRLPIEGHMPPAKVPTSNSRIKPKIAGSWRLISLRLAGPFQQIMQP